MNEKENNYTEEVMDGIQLTSQSINIPMPIAHCCDFRIGSSSNFISTKGCHPRTPPLAHPPKINSATSKSNYSVITPCIMDSSEHAIQCAIKDLNDGVFTSQRKAAKKYEVPESTLR
ncbi:hypothetical protein K3495_g391, partial [Podosphaera aphanis]